jgi:tetratricopeptide (TPR) repeat protein
MPLWKVLECPHCRESFEYAPSKQLLRAIEEMESRFARRADIVVDCPHCPTELILHGYTGAVDIFSEDALATAHPRRDVIYTTPSGTRRKLADEWIAKGHNLMTSDTLQAEACFREALKICKRDAIAWYNLGVCRYRAGDYADAESSYRRALALDPDMIQTWNNLGTMLLEIGRVTDGEGCFDAGIKADPKYPKFYLGKANVCYVRGDVEGARAMLQRALAIDPQYQLARFMLSKLPEKTDWPSRMFERS